ncbi:MAG: CHASE2 domain-containing protein, partial [Planctomycetes bacterium]|nr:CHASE2 domain-containing protein [Planctomycetota bacterium]
MEPGNTIDRALKGLDSTLVRARQLLRKAKVDFGHAHEPRQKAMAALAACAVACLLTAALLARWGRAAALDYAEFPLQDLRVRALESNASRDKDILLIVIDEDALAYGDEPFPANEAEGAVSTRYAWPWPRHVYSKILRWCRAGGARVVVFDFIFSETGPNTNAPRLVTDVGGNPETLFTLDRAGDDLFVLEATARDDVALALTLSGTPREPELKDRLLQAYAGGVAGPGADAAGQALHSRYSALPTADTPFAGLLDGWPDLLGYGRQDPETGLADLAALREMADSDATLNASPRFRSLLPLPKADAPRGVGGVGTVASFDDADGEARRADLLSAHDGRLYRSLPLEAWRLYVLSFAREAGDAAAREAFAARFPGLRLEAGRLLVRQPDGTEFASVLSGGLRDVPVHVQDSHAYYLGREIPVEDDGRYCIRYRGRLPTRELPSYAVAPNLFEGQDPDAPAFAVYPQISAMDVLRDWDLRNENSRLAAERTAAASEISRLERDLQTAAPEAREPMQAELEAARKRLKAAGRTHPVLFGEPAGLVKDKVVFVAGTASGLLDRHATPLSSQTPGTWIIANEFDNLKNSDFLRALPRWVAWLTALLAAAGTVLAVALAGRLRNALVLTLLAALLVGVASWVLFTQQVWLHTSGPLAGLFVGFSCGTLAKALTEGRQKRQRETFARQYMGTELLDHVIRNPRSLKLGGENRDMTIYFSDVAGFTTVTETLGPNNPERLVELLNIYLERMTDLMLGTGGVIDKYIGDAIMCFWGAPRDMQDHAVRACRGALLCRTELARMQPLFADAIRGIAPQLIKPNGEVLHARAGINSGVVTVGNMGSSKRFAYTVMGDAVNLAARLEPQCKEYGTETLIGPRTAALVKGEFTLRRIDLMVVKGKTEPTEVFELVGDTHPPQFIKDLLEPWERGVDLFRDRQFEQALACFRKAAALEQNQEAEALTPSKLYIERCESLIAHPPPPEWNGVY